MSVAAVVTDNDGRILVIRRADNGRWEIPGGVLELAEGLEAGVRREVAEETGIQITVETLSGVYKNVARGIVALVFRCRPSSGVAQPTTEAAEVRWMTPNEVKSCMHPVFAIRVLDALQTSPQHRDHDGVNLTAPMPN